MATGPLTNVALALRLCPKIAGRIGEILLMGGSVGAGNITPAAEFNMFCDPEAADIVFRSGIPIRMVGLDVTQKAMCTPEIYERIRGNGGKSCELFGDMMQYYCRMEKEVFGVEGGALHDPVTIAKFAEENGYYASGSGSAWTLMSQACVNFGLNSKELNLDENKIKTALDEGKPVICAMGPGVFTDGGHYIVIAGYNDSGFIIRDPNSPENSARVWAFDEIRDQIKNLWSFEAA